MLVDQPPTKEEQIANVDKGMTKALVSRPQGGEREGLAPSGRAGGDLRTLDHIYMYIFIYISMGMYIYIYI